jgi:hypothetical protein
MTDVTAVLPPSYRRVCSRADRSRRQRSDTHNEEVTMSRIASLTGSDVGR